MKKNRRAWSRVATTLVAATLTLAACAEEPLRVPNEAEAATYFEDQRRVDVEVSGNVVVVNATQSIDQLRRGGGLWAEVGPYVYLFSEPVRDLLTEWNGVAAVRVVTRTPGGSEVANVIMERGALNDITWRRALNISGLARRDGTDRPTLLRDLVDWGERHTTYEYNPAWAGD